VYHQIADGVHYTRPGSAWPAMRDEQIVGSVEWKDGPRLVRLETYAKAYHRLVAPDRDFVPHGGGTGRAHGVDLLVKAPLPGDVNARLTWSCVESRRTDPATGIVARAPWAVKHSATLILDRAFGEWKISVAGRWATGRAFTPVVGSVTSDGVPAPLYGAPNSETYPAFRRLDCTLARIWALSDRVTAVTYVAGFNLAGWDNVQSYAYSPDFTTRRAVPTLFSRGLFFGVNLIFR
jgi:hypothetical protein